MTLRTRAFIAVVSAAGICVLVWGACHWTNRQPARFLCYLLVATLASRLKVRLPGITGTMSVNFLFILLGIVELSLPETLALGCCAILVQVFTRDKPQLVQVFFNVCGSAWAIAAAYQVYYVVPHGDAKSPALPLIAAVCTYFVGNTVPVAAVISLTEQKSLRKIYSEFYFWSFPYFVMGAGLAGLVSYFNRMVEWQTSLLVLPAVYLIYHSYHLYLGKLQDEKRHVEEMASLHLRTIEALALAIEAKDHTTHDHLQRVRVYAGEVGRELKLPHDDMEALQAAALLHDIGKLAIPEHIISKPGRLTPEEFEKMKIHPLVGAEILERVRFPYPVVPIVRAHHEKWDGSGYPFGLKGAEIPIGARILSAVDFLDALASDRQYRRAIPLEEVMDRLRQESGKSFDPKVVAVLQRCYVEMESLVRGRAGQVVASKLSTDMKIERGEQPATGFASASTAKNSEATFLVSIAAARQEAQALFELSQDLGASLSLGETLSVFSVKLKRLVPYDSIAIYIQRDEILVPEHASGDDFRQINSLRIPVGGGVSGWVAQNRKPMVNGNPLVEPGYHTEGRESVLHSALSVPLEGLDGVVGVLTLYKQAKDGFTADHLRVLLAVSSKMALSIENALKYQQAESSATTDYLTGLPNARSLFLQLEKELARCKRQSSTLTVMVCDMDGFKQINDRFGHLEGNRVLKIFAQRLRESCREYDYVARMGGDEFVMVAPGLTADATRAKTLMLREIATRAGYEVCREETLSLSVGQAVYPESGLDAESLLAEADRRMYHEKLQQPGRKNRRTQPRLVCRLTVTLEPDGSSVPVLGNLSNISLGGCYIETGALIPSGTKVKVYYSAEDNSLQNEGVVARSTPGAGIGIAFALSEDRTKLNRIIEHVEGATKFYDRQLSYVARMASR